MRFSPHFNGRFEIESMVKVKIKNKKSIGYVMYVSSRLILYVYFLNFDFE